MKTIVILSPRILLSVQQLKAILDDLTANGVRPRLINLNSGEVDQKTINRFYRENGLDPATVRNTTSPTALKEYYEDALRSSAELLLISSTYHSAPRLKDAGIPIDIALFDEAQYLVGTQFQECLTLGQYQYSFTATQKITDDPNGLGMNNVARFGDVVYTQSPKVLIAAGEIVPPAVHVVDMVDGRTNIDENDFESIAQCIVDAYLKHEVQIETKTAAPEKIGAKLLITCDGQESLMEVMQSQSLRNFQLENPDVKLFALCSDHGITMNNLKLNHSPRAKELFIEELNKMDSNDRAIILHVDMIAEGLDVPGITGVMPFRNLGQTKFLQTLGRATRLHAEDRSKLYSGELQAGDFDGFIKPFAWVIIPRVLTNGRDAYARYIDYVDTIRTQYEFTSRDLVVVDDSHGISTEDDTLENINLPPDEDKGPLTKASIAQFFHNIEDSEHAALKVGEFWHDAMYAALLNEALSDEVVCA